MNYYRENVSWPSTSMGSEIKKDGDVQDMCIDDGQKDNLLHLRVGLDVCTVVACMRLCAHNHALAVNET